MTPQRVSCTCPCVRYTVLSRIRELHGAVGQMPACAAMNSNDFPHIGFTRTLSLAVAVVAGESSIGRNSTERDTEPNVSVTCAREHVFIRMCKVSRAIVSWLQSKHPHSLYFGTCAFGAKLWATRNRTNLPFICVWLSHTAPNVSSNIHTHIKRALGLLRPLGPKRVRQRKRPR